jgi:mercuric ion binding protein
MKKQNLLSRTLLLLCVSGVLGAQFSWGGPRNDSVYATQTFRVENMTCAACPITVRKAMSRVEGVQRVEVDFEAKVVTATFDPEITAAGDIAEASTAVGFPAHPIGETNP